LPWLRFTPPSCFRYGSHVVIFCCHGYAAILFPVRFASRMSLWRHFSQPDSPIYRIIRRCHVKTRPCCTLRFLRTDHKCVWMSKSSPNDRWIVFKASDVRIRKADRELRAPLSFLQIIYIPTRFKIASRISNGVLKINVVSPPPPPLPLVMFLFLHLRLKKT
jgi:hypothetical protein